MPYPRFSWHEPPPSRDQANAKSITDRLHVPLPIANVLLARAPNDPDAFLQPKWSSSSCDTLPGISEAVTLICDAIDAKKRIIVFGDFDADGICATTILVRALRLFQANVRPFIPDRLLDGYGLSVSALKRCRASSDFDLLITVDCGITSCHEVDLLHTDGKQVIVTDHHERADTLPNADVLIDPVLPGTPIQLRNLCGAGVAFKLIESLCKEAKRRGYPAAQEKLAKNFLVETAIATIGDVVPLTGENRTIVWNALRIWPQIVTTGLKQLLLEISKNAPPDTPPDSDFLAFSIVPHINAAGRIKDAMIAYNLLNADDTDQAAELAIKLKQLNLDRKNTEQTILKEAREQVLASDKEAGAIVVGKYGWHQGVVGIVAARLVEEHQRPAAVIVMDGEDLSTAGGHGSIRAGDLYNAKTALDQCAEVLQAYGGHPGAAGFTIKPGMLSRFKTLFQQACAKQNIDRKIGKPALQIDGWIQAKDLTKELYLAQQRLGPFGTENPKLRWGIREVVLHEVCLIGSKQDHLSFRSLTQYGITLPNAVWWRKGKDIEWFRSHSKDVMDLVVELDLNHFNGKTDLSCRILDIRLHPIPEKN